METGWPCRAKFHQNIRDFKWYRERIMKMLKYEKWVVTAEEFVTRIIDASRLKKCSIMVTGATGLIGSAVLDILIYLNENKGYEMNLYAAVRMPENARKRFGPFYQKPYFHIVSYDANQPVDFDFSVDYIIQAASNADPAAIQEYPVETLMSNVYGVRQMLEYSRKKQIRRMLFVSSSEVYGTNTTGELFKETDYGAVDILNPRASYPMGKRAAETLCVSYAEEYDLDTVIVRPGHIYGPTITERDSRASAQFTRKALAGENIVMKSEGRQLRSYCYVYDCATAILTVLLNGHAGSAYNISNKDSVISIRDIASLFAEKGNTQLIFEIPTDKERAGYNLMDMSALNAGALEQLGWRAVADAPRGVEMTLQLME